MSWYIVKPLVYTAFFPSVTFFCFCDQHWWNLWDLRRVASSGGPDLSSHVSEHIGPGDLSRSPSFFKELAAPLSRAFQAAVGTRWGSLPLPNHPSQKLRLLPFSELIFLSLGQRPLLRPYKSKAGKKLLLPGSPATLILQHHPPPSSPTIPLASTFPPQAPGE